MLELHNGLSENVLPDLAAESFHGVFTDPPYNISRQEVIGTTKNLTGLVGRKDIRCDMGEWDKNFSPSFLIDQAARLLVTGGWFAAFCSDHLFPYYHILVHEHEQMKYKATITWRKVNPTPQVRRKTFLSACEYIVLAIKGDEDQKPISWNWLGQRSMHNFVEGPLCSYPERLYWHEVDGEIFPCEWRDCKLCHKHGIDHRTSHPSQKPMYTWEWLYARLLEPGMSVIDPYGGVFTSGKAAIKNGLQYVGVEASPIFFEVGQRWLHDKWTTTDQKGFDIVHPMDRVAQFDIGD